MATKTLSCGDVDRIVSMSDREWADHDAGLVRAERDTYSRYHGVTPAHVYVAGTPQAAGHGSMVGGFVGQERWLAARAELLAARRVRLGAEAAWSVRVADGVALYAYRFSATDIRGCDRGTGHGYEVVTGGVDVSDCRTPTEAIRKVRATSGLAV